MAKETVKFVLEKRPLDRALRIIGTALGDVKSEKTKHIKVTVGKNGLDVWANNSLTFAKAHLAVDYPEGPPELDMEFCVEGARFTGAMSVLDENERIHITYDHEKSYLEIENGKMQAPFPTKKDTLQNFEDFTKFLAIKSEAVEYPIKDFVHALTFLRKFPQDSGTGTEASSLIELKGEAFVGGNASRVGYYFSDEFSGKMKVANDVLPAFLSVLKNLELNHFNFRHVKDGEDEYSVVESGDYTFGFKEWGVNIPDSVLKRQQLYQSEHVVRGDKTWLQSILRKLAKYLELEAEAVTLVISGEGAKGQLTVAVTNELTKSLGKTGHEYFNVFREKGTGEHQVKVAYKVLLDVLDSVTGNNIALEVDKNNVIKVGEDTETTKAIALLSPVRT